MLNKLGAAVKAIINDLKGIRADVSALQNAPTAAPGEPGISPDINLIIDKVLARIPAPVPGKDGTSPDVDAVSFKVLGQMPKPKDGKDGKDAEPIKTADIVAAVLAEIPTPKDGHSPDLNAITDMVLAKIPAAQEITAADGKPGKAGKPGKNGVSITKVKLEKGNKLAVWLDGVRRQVGVIDIPKPVASFTPNSGGGSGGRRPPQGISIRVSWLALNTPPEYQLCTVDDVPQPIAFTSIKLEEPPNTIQLDAALGEFTFLKAIDHGNLALSLQVIRQLGGGGEVLWGVYFQSWDGVSAWEDVPDSTRYLSFNKDVAGELQNLSYVGRTGAIVAGAKFRIVQICSDVSKNVGIVSAKPFANAPLSAGVVLSIGN